MNSLKDEVKDAIVEVIGDWDMLIMGDESVHYERAAEIADAVFGVMGIIEDEQDLSGFWTVRKLKEER